MIVVVVLHTRTHTLQGELIYANFGDTDDFRALKLLGVSCEGRIVMMKYGKIFRGLKVIVSQQVVLSGLISPSYYNYSQRSAIIVWCDVTSKSCGY